MFVGRVAETKELLRLTTLKSSDLLMVTCRRRVGKTYIINEVLKEYKVFRFTGHLCHYFQNQKSSIHYAHCYFWY
jgi:AAA+ ATPase superfamily predicted ATPase